MSTAWLDFFPPNQESHRKIHIQSLPIRLEIKGPVGTVGGEIFQQISPLHLRDNGGQIFYEIFLLHEVMETQNSGRKNAPKTCTIFKTSRFWSTKFVEQHLESSFGQFPWQQAGPFATQCFGFFWVETRLVETRVIYFQPGVNLF